MCAIPAFAKGLLRDHATRLVRSNDYSKTYVTGEIPRLLPTSKCIPIFTVEWMNQSKGSYSHRLPSGITIPTTGFDCALPPKDVPRVVPPQSIEPPQLYTFYSYTNFFRVLNSHSRRALFQWDYRQHIGPTGRVSPFFSYTNFFGEPLSSPIFCESISPHLFFSCSQWTAPRNWLCLGIQFQFFSHGFYPSIIYTNFLCVLLPCHTSTEHPTTGFRFYSSETAEERGGIWPVQIPIYGHMETKFHHRQRCR